MARLAEGVPNVAKIRVPVIYRDGAYMVDLPNYAMVPGSWAGGPAEIHHVDGVHWTVDPAEAARYPITCEVEVPNHYIREDGELDTGAVDADRPENIVAARQPPEQTP